MLPDSNSKNLSRWQDFFKVMRQTGPINYKVEQPGHQTRFHVYHVNLLKRWKDSEELLMDPALGGERVGTRGVNHKTGKREESPVTGKQLDSLQKNSIQMLGEEFWNVFTEEPGKATGVEHLILTSKRYIVREQWHWLPRYLYGPVCTELDQMKRRRFIEKLHSPWRSPMVVVSKPVTIIRLCMDVRKVNVVSTSDAFPMPHIEEMLEKIRQAHFISMLDLTKGYWQIPMAQRHKEKTAFGTP